jgi:hypothetical protein
VPAAQQEAEDALAALTGPTLPPPEDPERLGVLESVLSILASGLTGQNETGARVDRNREEADRLDAQNRLRFAQQQREFEDKRQDLRGRRDASRREGIRAGERKEDREEREAELQAEKNAAQAASAEEVGGQLALRGLSTAGNLHTVEGRLEALRQIGEHDAAERAEAEETTRDSVNKETAGTVFEQMTGTLSNAVAQLPTMGDEERAATIRATRLAISALLNHPNLHASDRASLREFFETQVEPVLTSFEVQEEEPERRTVLENLSTAAGSSSPAASIPATVGAELLGSADSSLMQTILSAMAAGAARR